MTVSAAELTQFLVLQAELCARLRARHGAVHAVTCGCDHFRRGDLECDGETWQWWAHWFGVCFERQADRLTVDAEADGGEPDAIDPYRLQLYLRSRGQPVELAPLLARLDELVTAGVLRELAADGRRPGVRRFALTAPVAPAPAGPRSQQGKREGSGAPRPARRGHRE